MPLILVAKYEGKYEGELTIWIENALRSETIQLEIDVLPHPAPWLGR
jgi:hypothetical protein